MAHEILFIAHRAPWPPDRGDRIRSWHMLEALLKLAPVHVAALADHDGDAQSARSKLAPLCASVHLSVRSRSRPVALAQSMVLGAPASVRAFGSEEMSQNIAGLLRQGRITHIVGFSGQTAQYLPPRSQFSGPVLLDLVDVDSAKFEQLGGDAGAFSPMGWVNRREGAMLSAYEREAAARADLVSFVTDAEADLFRQRSGASNVCTLGNGIDTVRFDPAGDFIPLDFDTRPLGPLCVFTGQMDYGPNVEAVSHFARDVLPQLRERVTAASFAIVGRAPTREVQALATMPGVHVTGEVPDVRPWLAAADVVVAPLKLARGIQNKLLEAMAMAKPVVASSGAAQGIDAADDQHLLIADGPAATIGAVAALFGNAARCKTIGAAARAQMVARYGWRAQMAPLAAMLGIESPTS